MSTEDQELEILFVFVQSHFAADAFSELQIT